ncbi:MAG: Asp-tRNA(Asn)/Glu-tRNA(Gln) amidotransferase subunit GatC [Clostridiaceae bacterium]|jgi:aspartyl-tRNA(Asn)/glutamyl-tRNA(Gln) amidotransferase subunit C|nr:Asp-tRNA(Asn)/Glu-tRNA(Gln) amidotransferase subunit GatC [Clostridiaceae bacterium]
MAITDRDIQYVAELARLSLSEEEADRLAKDMESIIGYSMNKLKELDTDAVKPMEHVLSKRNVFRLDECEKSFDRDELLQNAPDKENGCFRVPQVVDGN